MSDLLVIQKQADGRYRIEAISTAAVPDQQGETFSIEAIDYDIARAKETGEYPEFRLFHKAELGFGKVTEMKRIGIFAHDVGYSYDDAFSKEVCEKMLQNNPQGKWRISRGFIAEEVSGNCPNCNQLLGLTKKHMQGFQCPECGSTYKSYRDSLSSVRFDKTQTFDVTVTDIPVVPYTSVMVTGTDIMKGANMSDVRERLLEAGLSEDVVDDKLNEAVTKSHDEPVANAIYKDSGETDEGELVMNEDELYSLIKKGVQEVLKELEISVDIDPEYISEAVNKSFADVNFEVDTSEIEERLEAIEKSLEPKATSRYKSRKQVLVRRFKSEDEDYEDDEEEDDEEVVPKMRNLKKVPATTDEDEETVAKGRMIGADGRTYKSATAWLQEDI